MANWRAWPLLSFGQFIPVDTPQNRGTNITETSNFSREGKNLDPSMTPVNINTTNEKSFNLSQKTYLCISIQPAASSF